uniref:Ras-related protein Rab-21 n=1 Tax=Mesocestoides corti TaxID=53468 RepID=A0A5K3G2U5_MESCO
MAKEHDLYTYVECSALTGEGIKNVFDTVIRAAINPGRKSKRHQCSVM